MRIIITTEGAEEKARALTELRNQVSPEARIALEAGLQPIRDAMKTYPSGQSHLRPRWAYVRGVGALYLPTGHQYHESENYRERITSGVRYEGSDIVGYINSAASYSTYLRGDLDGYPGAWMHRPFWENLQSIVDRYLPQVTQLIDRTIARLIQKLGLGGD